MKTTLKTSEHKNYTQNERDKEFIQNQIIALSEVEHSDSTSFCKLVENLSYTRSEYSFSFTRSECSFSFTSFLV